MYSLCDPHEISKIEKRHPLVKRFYCISLTLPKRQILDSSKLKEFADDNTRFDENGR